MKKSNYISLELQNTINNYIKQNDYRNLLIFLRNCPEVSDNLFLKILLQYIPNIMSLTESEIYNSRFNQVQTIDDIVIPILQMKTHLLRIEFLSNTSVNTILSIMVEYNISTEELMWLIDMYCLNPQLVIRKLASYE